MSYVYHFGREITRSLGRVPWGPGRPGSPRRVPWGPGRVHLISTNISFQASKIIYGTCKYRVYFRAKDRSECSTNQ